MSPRSEPAGLPAIEALVSLPGVAEAAGAARAMVDRLLTSAVVSSGQDAAVEESLLRGARASADLEGSGFLGASRVYAELPRLRSVWRSSPRQAMARLHLLAAAELTEPDLLGRPKDSTAAAALARVGKLALLPSAVPAVVLAALVHGDLVVAAPFAGGNGLVARAAQRLVLAGRGLDPRLLGVPEVGHRELGDYAEAVAAYGTGGPEGVALWLRHCCAAVEAGARESLAIAQAGRRAPRIAEG